MTRFAEVHGSRRGSVSVPGHPYRPARYRTEQLPLATLGRYPGTFVVALAVPAGRFLSNRTAATESGESFPNRITNPDAAEAISLHRRDLFDSQQRIGDVLVVGEHCEVESSRHSLSLAAGSTS